MRFSSVFVFASLVVSSFASTVADVKADIAALSTQLNILDSSVKEFPSTGGTLAQGLAIHNNGVILSKATDKALTDTQACPPFSAADGRTILDKFKAQEPIITEILEYLVIKKPAFDSLPLGNVSKLVKQDLAILEPKTKSFVTELIAKGPKELAGEATALEARISAKFEKAKAAYA